MGVYNDVIHIRYINQKVISIRRNVVGCLGFNGKLLQIFIYIYDVRRILLDVTKPIKMLTLTLKNYSSHR